MGIHQITHLNKILVQQDQGKEIQCLLIRETSINRSPGTNIHRGALCKMVITDLHKVELLNECRVDRGIFHLFEMINLVT